MRLTFPLFAGTSQPTRQQQSPVAFSNNGTASPLAGQALTSDVTSFSRVSPAQPRFGAWSSLHEAIYDSGNTISPDLRAKIRQAGPEGLNEQDEDGCTPLHTAASLGYHHVVRFLLSQQGIDPSIREYEDNSTARDLAEGIDDPQARAKTIEEFTKKGY